MKKPKHLSLIVFLLIIIVLVIFAIGWGRNTMEKAKSVFAYVDELQALADTGLSPDSIQSAIEISGELSFAIDDLKIEVDPLFPMLRSLGKLPRIGGYFGNVEPLLDFSSNLTKAVVILGRTGEPIIEEGFSKSEMSQLQTVYEFFSSNQLNFAVAENYLQDAQANWRQVDAEFIPERFEDEISTVDEYMQLSSSLFDVLEIIPQLLGSEEHATFLFMVQNKDELRPSGGFITGFGILQIRAGRIFALEIDDSTFFDYVSEVREPPFPIKELMFANYLVPRDANWSPDFPIAAQETQEIYQLSTDIGTDGVIAFDQLFLVELFEFLGPITFLDEIGEINAENFESKMIEYKQLNWENGTISQRKEFFSILAPKLMEKIFQKSQFSDLIDLGKIMLDEMQAGHVSIFLNDPEAQKIIESFELDGAVQPGTGDYIMLVDANIGFGKTDQFIERSLDYSIDLTDPGEPKGELVIKYEHSGSLDERCFQGRRLHDKDLRFRDYYFSRCYWDYWRVLLHNNAKIEDVQFIEVPLEYFYEGVEWDQTPAIGEGENSTTEVGGLIVVPQSSEQTVQIAFQPSENLLVETDDGRLSYSLRIQKQNGIDYLPIEIQVTPPEGFDPIEMQAGWIYNAEENVLIWESVIDRTIDLVLNFADNELRATNPD